MAELEESQHQYWQQYCAVIVERRATKQETPPILDLSRKRENLRIQRDIRAQTGYQRRREQQKKAKMAESAANLLREDFDGILRIMLNSKFDEIVVVPDTLYEWRSQHYFHHLLHRLLHRVLHHLLHCLLHRLLHRLHQHPQQHFLHLLHHLHYRLLNHLLHRLQHWFHRLSYSIMYSISTRTYSVSYFFTYSVPSKT